MAEKANKMILSAADIKKSIIRTGPEGIISEVYNMDCLEAMVQYSDNFFDLAVIDPPYGLSEDGRKSHKRTGIAPPKKYKIKSWDSNPPDQIYFDNLLRISKNQIIFGANHFIEKIPINSAAWLAWDKLNGQNHFADIELAWTSFSTAARLFRFKWAGMLQGNMKEKEVRIHPTQKPVALYDWIFENYAKPGFRILDTHLGSGSSRIAANKAGLHFTAFEKDPDYFQEADVRFRRFISQLRLF